LLFACQAERRTIPKLRATPTDLQRLKRDTEIERVAALNSGTVAAPSPRAVKLWEIAVPVLLITILAAGGLYYRSDHQGNYLSGKDTIVLADFANSTGDAVFDDTLTTALSVALNQSPFLNVLSGNKVAATLKLMSRPASTKLTPEVARELCQRAGSKAYVVGSIASLGWVIRHRSCGENWVTQTRSNDPRVLCTDFR